MKDRKAKDFFKLSFRIIKYLMQVDLKNFVIYFVTSFLIEAEPVIFLLLLQNVINLAVQGIFDIKYIIIIGIMKLFVELVSYYNNVVKTKFSYLIDYKVNNDIQAKVVELEIKDFEDKELHNSLQRATNSSGYLQFYFPKIVSFINRIITLVAYLIILVSYNAALVLIVLIIPVLLLIKKFKVLRESFIKRWENVDNWRKSYYYAHVLTFDTTLKESKILNADLNYLKKYKESRKAAIDVATEIALEMKKIDRDNRIGSAFNLIVYYTYLIYNLANGNLKVGNFNTYRTAYSNVIFSIDNLFVLLSEFETDTLEMKELFIFLDYNNNYVDGKKTLKGIDKIEFKNVSFKYPNGEREVLKNINLTLNKGESVAFIGQNGSGKTTIMKLIEKVYEPTSGEILINGININEYQTRSVRDNISMLLQDFCLFQETVKDNILLRGEKASEKKLNELVAYKDLRKRIKELPEGFNTVLGNWFGDGVNFSKGQIQKLALSRIFAQKSNMVLLDEPNSALDPKAEKDMFKFINSSDKTCIITLHVFTNIDSLDKIVMFEEGKIVAEGHHKDLYKNNIAYKEFYDLQERSDI